MATTFFFNGREIIEPGVYSQIISGVKNPIREMDYGRILLIDTGFWNKQKPLESIDMGWGAGPGIQTDDKGTIIENGKSAIQYFDNMRDFRTVVRGGPFWAAAPFLFQPKGYNIPGISGLYYMKAAKTTPASVTVGGIIITSINEGIVGNAVDQINSATTIIDHLKKGFLLDIRAGKVANYYVADFWMGTYRGKDIDGIEWNGAVAEKSLAQLMFSSPEFKNYSELKEWMEINIDVRQWFKTSGNPAGTGVVKSYGFSGGSDIYDTFPSIALLEQVFEVIKELDYVFVLSDVYGDNVLANSVIQAILQYHQTEAKYEKYLQVGGGLDANRFESISIAFAKEVDTSRAVVAHGGFYKGLRRTGVNTSSIILKEYNSFFKASITLGRILGKEPQVPGTFKTLNYDGEVHELKDTERETGLKKGVLCTKWDNELNDFTIVQAVNTLQDNSFLVNEDGQSYEISVERIKAQLNREISVGAKRDLLTKENGSNRNTLSAADLKIWIETYLKMKTATSTDDNLIIYYQNVTVETRQDAYFCSYEFQPNWPVNKILVTGVIIEV